MQKKSEQFYLSMLDHLRYIAFQSAVKFLSGMAFQVLHSSLSFRFPIVDSLLYKHVDISSLTCISVIAVDLPF